MAPPTIPVREVMRAAELYHEAVASGAVPIGGIVGTGRTSVMTAVARMANWTDHQTTLRVHRALSEGLLATDYPGEAEWGYARENVAQIDEGVVLVGSDLHVWPGRPHAIWWAFLMLAHRLEPAAIILNGDVLDGARISRHGRWRGGNVPSIKQEIDAAQGLLAQLPEVSRYWTMGNHDARLDNYIANQAPELDDIAGGLPDRFPGWQFSYSVVLNREVEVRHRFRSGVHAAWNNTLHSGRTMLTGHTHQLSCTAMEDRQGRRWGVECGMLADPAGPQFQYTEDAPRRWRPGFVVLTFRERRLQTPEFCEWRDDKAWFRGDQVKPRVRISAGGSV